jgi:hypothetical protein
MDNIKATGSSPVQPLPSEWAQTLAQHLANEVNRFTSVNRYAFEDGPQIDSQDLARIIQEFYDSIP